MKHFAIKSEQLRLSGVIHEAKESSNPIILIVHGYFSSNKTGYNRLYFHIASILASKEFTTVRFDLSGMGESEGNLTEINFENHVVDVVNVTKFINNKYKRKIILLGHSIGCLLALQAYHKNPNFYNKIILLSPLFFNDTVLSRFFNKKMISELKEIGHTIRKGINVNYSFFDYKMSLDNIANNIKDCKIPIILITGDSDLFFENKEINELNNAAGTTPTIIKNCDHNFSEIPSREILINEILSFINS